MLFLKTRFHALSSLLLLCGIALFLSACRAPSEPALTALKSDNLVEITTNADFIALSPKNMMPKTGFVFYPGGFVDERAYAPLCRDIAAAGFYVAIVPQPLGLAVLAPDKGKIVLEKNKNISIWAIGGHSLGGAMAARLVHQDSTLFRGLVVYASYPDVSNDLSKRTGLKVLSVFGSLDGLATPEKIDENKKYLPASTQYLRLEGGNHAQFGSYGAQNGDKEATMSAAEQQRRIAEATTAFLRVLR
ncbi:MAG: alpha/beta hydrolase [Candidatus Kapaibacterium sp.]|nr:MAG: alpha/beta hydrolase [Candidatus Kapabacteria bacterium]